MFSVATTRSLGFLAAVLVAAAPPAPPFARRPATEAEGASGLHRPTARRLDAAGAGG